MCFLFLMRVTSAWFSFLEEKNHQLMSSDLMTWCERGTEQGLTVTMELSQLESLLPRWVSCGRHRGSPQGTGRKAPRTQACRASSGMGHSCSAKHPLPCFSHHPYSLPYILILCAWGHRTDRNWLTGKKGKGENSTKRWPGFHTIVLRCLLNCCHLWR